MPRHIQSASLVAIIAVLGTCAPAWCAVIDDFSAPAVPGVILAVNGAPGFFTNPSSVTTVDGSIMGGVRTMTAQVGPTGSLPGVMDGAQVSVLYGGGTLNFNSSGPTGATLMVQYGTDAGGAALGNLSAAGGQFTLEFGFLNSSAPNMDIDIFVDTSTGVLAYSSTIPESEFVPFTFNALFSAFVGPGSFSSVNGITVVFNGGLAPNTDFNYQLGQGGFGFGPLPVPEPGSMLAWGVLVGAGLLYRRRMLVAKP